MSTSLLRLDGIGVDFGGVTALREISFDVRPGGVHGVIGPNGAGKTTLINVITGLVPASRGRMTFDGRQDGPWGMAVASRLGIARTFQTPRAFMNLPVGQNVDLALRAGVAREGSDPAWTDRVDSLFELTPLASRMARDLSYGELRRLSIALSVLARPQLLLMDEPTVGLSKPEIQALEVLIRALRDEGVTIMLVEHNMPFLMSMADHVTVLANGALLFEGSPQACQESELVIRAYLGEGLDVAG